MGRNVSIGNYKHIFLRGVFVKVRASFLSFVNVAAISPTFLS